MKGGGGCTQIPKKSQDQAFQNWPNLEEYIEKVNWEREREEEREGWRGRLREGAKYTIDNQFHKIFQTCE